MDGLDARLATHLSTRSRQRFTRYSACIVDRAMIESHNEASHGSNKVWWTCGKAPSQRDRGFDEPLICLARTLKSSKTAFALPRDMRKPT